MSRDYFTNTSGTAPQSGIDIEPNSPSDYLLDINITDCYTNDNAGDGLMISPWMMNSTSQPIGITVVRHHSTGQSSATAMWALTETRAAVPRELNR